MRGTLRIYLKKGIYYFSYVCVISMLIICAFDWYAVSSFHEWKQYPYLYWFVRIMIPISCVGLLGFVVYAVIRCIKRNAADKEHIKLYLQRLVFKGIAVTAIGIIPGLYFVGSTMQLTRNILRVFLNI